MKTRDLRWAREVDWKSWASDWHQITSARIGLAPETVNWLIVHAGERHVAWMMPTPHLLLIREHDIAIQFILEGRQHD